MEYSFIIPVYNCKDYLPDCIRSVRAAETEKCEILLIDDGSTDGSGELCEEFAAQYPEVRVIHQLNAGASAARNRGILESRGEKLLFLDADDSIDSDILHRILTDPRCDRAELTIFGLTFDYYRKGKCYRQDPLFFEHDGVLSKKEWGEAFARLYARNSLSPIWNKVFKREIFVEHRLELNTEMFLYEDLEFVLRYLCHCGEIWNVPQAVYHYRQPEDEGNAGRRLARIGSLPEFLLPMEAALTDLCASNPFVTVQQKDTVLQQLYLVIAKEKISVSGLPEVKRICREFSQWAKDHSLPVEASPFQKNLLGCRAWTLWLTDKKTAIRHKIAVWVKAHGLYK